MRAAGDWKPMSGPKPEGGSWCIVACCDDEANTVKGRSWYYLKALFIVNKNTPNGFFVGLDISDASDAKFYAVIEEPPKESVL